MADFVKLRVGLAQINPTVGALSDNSAKILDYYNQAVVAKCDIVAFPELSVTGYPPEDLVLKDGFVADNLTALAKIVTIIGDTVAVATTKAAVRTIEKWRPSESKEGRQSPNLSATSKFARTTVGPGRAGTDRRGSRSRRRGTTAVWLRIEKWPHS